MSLQAEAELTLKQPNPHNLRTTKRRRSVAGGTDLPLDEEFGVLSDALQMMVLPGANKPQSS